MAVASLDPTTNAPPEGVRRHEARARLVAAISVVVMAGELAAGFWLNSMALVSDGLHTATHAGAMFIAVAAYAFARRKADDPRYAFGAGKATDLAAFANGVALAVIAVFIALASLERFVAPQPVRLAEAAGVAGLGLAVSLLSALLLRDAHAGAPAPGAHGHAAGRDLNLWAAYLHMVADVVTSVVAIAALLAGAALHWVWLDAAVGLLNTGVVAAFAFRLLRRASAVLLDSAPPALIADIRARLDDGGAQVKELRVWTVAPDRFAVFGRLGGASPRAAADYRARLRDLPSLAHVLLEVEPASSA